MLVDVSETALCVHSILGLSSQISVSCHKKMMPGVVAGIQTKWEDIGNSNKSHDLGVSLLGLAGPQTMPHCIREK